MDDNNIVKFKRPMPKKHPRTVSSGQRKALLWLAAIAGIFIVWAYYQFVAVTPGP